MQNSDDKKVISNSSVQLKSGLKR